MCVDVDVCVCVWMPICCLAFFSLGMMAHTLTYTTYTLHLDTVPGPGLGWWAHTFETSPLVQKTLSQIEIPHCSWVQKAEPMFLLRLLCMACRRPFSVPAPVLPPIMHPCIPYHPALSFQPLAPHPPVAQPLGPKSR